MEHGLEPEEIYKEVGMSACDVARMDGEIPLKSWLRFLELAAEKAGNPILGIHLARSAGPETLGAIGFLFLSSATLFEALQNLCKYMNLLQGVTFAQLVCDEEETIFVYELMHAQDYNSRQDVEFSITLTKRLIRIFSEGAAKVLRVNFKHSPQCDPHLYERQMRVPVYFNQEENSVVLPAWTNKIQGRVLTTGLSPILKTYLDKELATISRALTLSDQIERLLFSNRIDFPITAKKVAIHLGVSEPTLFRRLAAEGKKFSSISGSFLYMRARDYLDSSTLTITEIAYLLGFADSASFSRAFSRWSDGVAPSRYRGKA